MVFFKLKNNKDKPLEDDVKKNIANGVNVENAIITYLLLQAKANNISLAKKEDRTYIYINSKEINDFLNEWYTLLQLHQKKRLSDRMYDIFIRSQLDENTVDSYKQSNEDDVDEIL